MGASQPVQVFQQFKPSQPSNVNVNGQFIQQSQHTVSGISAFNPSQAQNVDFTSKPSPPSNVNVNSQFIKQSQYTPWRIFSTQSLKGIKCQFYEHDQFQDSYVSEISLIRRPVKLALEHSALFIESICVENGKQVKKFHIVEYMNDSQVHMQQVDKFEYSEKNVNIANINWKIQEFHHDETLKKLKVPQITEMLQQQADQKGGYNLLWNNCNQVAYEFFKILKSNDI